ncbi:MAG: M1 family metallopeptidase [Bacteroidia bacterium]|nr:M1 family metallopeptidase [Bacteroidia bacterium]
MGKRLFGLCAGLMPLTACAQKEVSAIFHGRPTYTRADTLLGSLNPYRSCYDVVHYDLNLRLSPARPYVEGEVTCTFRWLGGADTLQIDLLESFKVQGVWLEGQSLPFQRVRGTRAIWIPLSRVKAQLQKGQLYRWKVAYAGRLQLAPRPPWEGGFVRDKTPSGEPWLGFACQGLGASIWWPLKDHLSDKPDSAQLTFCLPPPFRVIANGIYQRHFPRKKDTCFTYRVSHPINTYNITFYAAPAYLIHEDTFQSASGRTLPLRFAVLPVHASKIPYLVQHAHRVLRAMEHFFGPFPHQQDGYGLVEAPYYGMEHQSAIAYGNQFRTDPQWGFDYIILHESGHEWWGNHVSASDNADLWIQEGFCTYAEALYLEYYQGAQAAQRYLNQQRTLIQNRLTIQGPPGVNADQTHNTDIYYKMAWVLHTLRSRLANDSLWFACLRAIQQHFAYQAITGSELIRFMSNFLGEDLEPFFRAYLNYLRPPLISFKVVREEGQAYLVARWITEEPNFAGPMEFLVDGQRLRVFLTQTATKIPLLAKAEVVIPDRNRYLVIPVAEP